METTKHLEILSLKQRYPRRYTFFRMLPWALTLVILLVMLSGYVLFIFDENVRNTSLIFRTLIIAMIYFIWRLIRGFEYTIYTILAMFKLFSYQRIDFTKVLKKSWPNTSLQQHMIQQLPDDMKCGDIVHRFILPTYNENYEILHETLTTLSTTNYDLSKIAVTIAGEAKQAAHFAQIWWQASQDFAWKFWYFSSTLHPADLPNELAGKWWNITRAAKHEYKTILEHFQTTPDHVLVTTLDADSNIDMSYLPTLTYTYLVTPDRKKKSYQPIIFFYNNFRDAPFFSKVVSLCNTFRIMFNAMKKFWTRNFSTHAQPLDGLLQTDFRSVQTIVEDGHQYRRSYFAFDGDYECIPVFTSVYQDANLNETFGKTAIAQYKQMRRWAHGAEDVAYSFCAWIDRRDTLPFWRTWYDVIRLLEGIILWSTLHLVLLGGIWFSLIKDIEINTFISLWSFVAICMKLSYVIMSVAIILQVMFCPWHKLNKEQRRKIPIFLILYIPLAGLVLVVFSGLPAFHTQLALMINKPMKKFNVTEKVRIEH